MLETQEQLFRFRFQMGMGQTEGLKKYRMLRKDKARLLTVMREKGVSEPLMVPAAPVATASKDKKTKKK